MIKARIIIGLVFLLASLIITGLWRYERSERIRFERNQSALMTDMVKYKTSDSLNVAEIETLTLTNREFKNHNSDLMKTVDELGLKVRRLENASSVGTKTITKVNTVIRDSIVYRENMTIDTIRCISFDDGWVSADGCVDGDKFIGKIVSVDTLQTFAYRIPRFLWFGTKSIRQTIVSSNPHTDITYAKEIKLRRK